MSQGNFEEHVREQGGVFRRGTMSQRCGTGDMDAEGEEGEVRGWLSLTCYRSQDAFYSFFIDCVTRGCGDHCV
jgi:hypothetical protein